MMFPPERLREQEICGFSQQEWVDTTNNARTNFHNYRVIIKFIRDAALMLKLQQEVVPRSPWAWNMALGPGNHETFAQALLRSPAVVDPSVAFVRPTNDQWLTLFGVTFSPAAGGWFLGGKNPGSDTGQIFFPGWFPFFSLASRCGHRWGSNSFVRGVSGE